MKLDNYDKLILKELIINPRLSDNKVSRITNIPVKTVNRKRRRLEENGIISYYASVDFGPAGTEDFTTAVMHIITFKYGIYRKQFLNACHSIGFNKNDSKHINFQWLGEKDGRLMLILIIESRHMTDILEIYNVEIVGKLEKCLGIGAISDTTTIPITSTISMLHNYLPAENIENGIIKKTWPKDMVFVGE